ncbi:MAG: aminoacyl-tRNA hydrolase [Candidatus Omnitrophota bacterium]
MATAKLIVGLGNPGREYEKTRHNAGFMVVRKLAAGLGVEFKKCRHAPAFTAEVRAGGERIILALPTTFMNNSGVAVGNIVLYDQLATGDVLVVCDDLRIDPGQLRLRLGGSDGGHNGLKSVSAVLGTGQYARLKVGIGAPSSVDRQVDFVLGAFSMQEVKILEGVLESACDCCRLWLAGDTPKAMTLYNKRKDNE